MMTTFDNYDMYAAIEHASNGGQAIHLHKMVFPHSPQCFRAAVKRGEYIAHLFDADEKRLVETARSLGVRVIKVEGRGTNRQHIDLCGAPLRAAIARAHSQRSKP